MPFPFVSRGRYDDAMAELARLRQVDTESAERLLELRVKEKEYQRQIAGLEEKLAEQKLSELKDEDEEAHARPTYAKVLRIAAEMRAKQKAGVK